MVNGDHDNSKSEGTLLGQSIFGFLEYLHDYDLSFFWNQRN